MTYEAFGVFDFRTGIDLSMEPWKIPSEAYTDINNGYLRRGVLSKRLGQSVFGQLGKFSTGQSKASPSPIHQTGNSLFKPVIPRSLSFKTGAKVARDDGEGNITGDVAAVGGAVVNTIDYVTGAYNFDFDAAPGAVITTIAYHYEVDEDTRGIFNFKRYTGSDLLVGVQKKRISVWNPTYEYFANIPDAAGAYDHFNSTELASSHSFNDILWITTNEASDNIWTYNGTIMIDQTTAGNLKLDTAGTENIFTALHVFSWKERICLLNTVDGAGAGTRHGNRVIWSWAAADPLSGTGFQWDIPGHGNYNDAWTSENIIDFAFLGNQPIIGFENSIWTLDYTSDPNLPFAWRQLPSVMQVSSTHGRLTYDNLITFVGGKGIVACNGNSTTIANAKIPDWAYSVDQTDISLCYSIRDDNLDQGLTAYPSIDTLFPNNQILVYNYEEKSYCYYTMNAKCFGYWQTNNDPTFDGFSGVAFDDLSSMNWGHSSLQAGFPMILSGWEKGYVYQINDYRINRDENNWLEKLELSGHSPQPYAFNWETGRLNPFINKGLKAVLGRIDILLSANDAAEFSIEFYSDMYVNSYMRKTVNCSTDEGLKKVWKSILVDNEANFHRLKYYLSKSQLLDPIKSNQQIKIHGVIYWMKPGGEIV